MSNLMTFELFGQLLPETKPMQYVGIGRCGDCNELLGYAIYPNKGICEIDTSCGCASYEPRQVHGQQVVDHINRMTEINRAALIDRWTKA